MRALPRGTCAGNMPAGRQEEMTSTSPDTKCCAQSPAKCVLTASCQPIGSFLSLSKANSWPARGPHSRCVWGGVVSSAD